MVELSGNLTLQPPRLEIFISDTPDVTSKTSDIPILETPDIPSLETPDIPSSETEAGVPSPPSEEPVRRLLEMDLEAGLLAALQVARPGSPADFSLRWADPAHGRRLARLLAMVVAPAAVPSPVQGQAVLLRDGTAWRRGCVLAVRANNRLVKLVDGRGTVELGRAELYQVPEEVVAVPVLTADCMLAGAERAELWGPHWGEEARKDWVRLLEGRELRLLRLVNPKGRVVELGLGEAGPGLGPCLQFLGHLSGPAPGAVCLETEGMEGRGTRGLGCPEQEAPSPDCLLLILQDSPNMEARIARLRQLEEVAAETSVPPGWVEEGSALVAPWEGGLYRARVLACQGSVLSLLFVDYGNVATADWSVIPMLFHCYLGDGTKERRTTGFLSV
jgi:hypothetical protein